MSDTCSICVNNYTSQKYKKIICKMCNFECCCECIKTYINNLTTDPICMSCRELYTVQFLITNLPKSFMNNEYKNCKKNVLFKFELSLLPETIPIVGYINQKNKYIQYLKKYNDVRLKNENEYQRYTQIYNSHSTNLLSNKDRIDVDKKINNLENIFENLSIYDNYDSLVEVQNKLSILKNERQYIYKIFNTIQNNIYDLNDLINGNQKNNNTKYTYIQKCANEDCKGSITDDYKCQVCDLVTCSICNIIVRENHECNPDDIATKQLIQNTSKPCPNCNILLFKIGGCDQFFCTSCYTPFSWNTGQIIKNQFFHNPHYIEMIANGTITNNDVFGNTRNNTNCNDIAQLYQNVNDRVSNLARNMRKYINKPDPNFDYTIRFNGIEDHSIIYLNYKNINHLGHTNIKKLIIPLFSNINRIYGHIYAVELRKYNNNFLTNNRDLRIKYLMKEINDDEFKDEIYKKYLKHEKNLEIYNILNSFILISQNLFLNFLTIDMPEFGPDMTPNIYGYFKQICNIIDQFDILKDKINEDLTEICKIYKIKNRQIYEDWSIFDFVQI